MEIVKYCDVFFGIDFILSTISGPHLDFFIDLTCLQACRTSFLKGSKLAEDH